MKSSREFADFYAQHHLKLIDHAFFDDDGGADFVGALLLARVLEPDQRCDELDVVGWRNTCATALDELIKLATSDTYWRYGLIDGNMGAEKWVNSLASPQQQYDYHQGYHVAHKARRLILDPLPAEDAAP